MLPCGFTQDKSVPSSTWWPRRYLRERRWTIHHSLPFWGLTTPGSLQVLILWVPVYSDWDEHGWSYLTEDCCRPVRSQSTFNMIRQDWAWSQGSVCMSHVVINYKVEKETAGCLTSNHVDHPMLLELLFHFSYWKIVLLMSWRWTILG